MSASKSKKHKIALYFRAKGADYSIERVFDSIIPKFDLNLSVSQIYVPHYLIRFTYILQNLIHCKNNKSEVNHITGVIHYCAFILPYSKTIITIHDLISVEHGKGLKKMIFWFFFFYLPLKKCKYVTCISESVRDSLIKYKCCPASKIVVIPNPVSDSFVYFPTVFNQEFPQILHIGTRPNKNLDSVIKALIDIPCHLVIIGEIGTSEQILLKENRIKYTNKKNLSDDEILKEYIDCDIVSFPSLYEGFGVPIIEGQAIGRPILTSNISPMKEVAGENYYLINPYDVRDIAKGFKDLIHNSELRSNLIAEGLLNVKKYNSDSIANMYMELYSKILNSKT